MGRKKMSNVVESTPVVQAPPVVSTEDNLKRYTAKIGDDEKKLVLPELSKTQDESIEIGDVTYVVSYDSDENQWSGDGCVIKPAKGQGPKLKFDKPSDGFLTWNPEGYIPGKHRTLQRVDFKGPWDYRLFRVKILLQHKKNEAESEYRKAFASIDDDFAEDIRVVKELEESF